MPDDSIFVPRIAECRVIGCKYHAAEARYEVRWYTNDALLLVFCIECKPAAEVLRVKVAREEPAKDNRHLAPKSVTPKVSRINGGE